MQETPRSLISAAAAEMGRRGARMQAEAMTPEQRSERARHAALKRWAATRKKKAKKTT